MKPVLSDADFLRASRELGVTPAHIKAVCQVEAPNGGFYANSDIPTVLFERHVMFDQVEQKFNRMRAEQYANRYPELCNKTPGGYGPSIDQPIRMDMAAKLMDRECALMSASWGKFQIMGYHWKSLGFYSLQSFINAMYAGEPAQLGAFVEFIREDPKLHQALKRNDWATFARRYNGPNYKKNDYDTKLEKAFTKAGGV